MTPGGPIAAPPERGLERRVEELEEAQRATFNILEDFEQEKAHAEEAQRATFNILEDFEEKGKRLEDTQRATFNILEDFQVEKSRLEQMQRATLNILEDLSQEKAAAERVNVELIREVAERTRAEEQIRRLSDDLERRAHELESANREIEAFSYSVSHDLRAPLRAIDGFAQVLLEDYLEKLDEGGQRSLERIRARSQEMGKLIDDLLSLSRLTRAEMHWRGVDLSAMAAGIIEEFRRSEPARSAEVSIQPGMGVRADERLLRVALENLLSNAWKFSGRRDVSRIEVGSQPHEGGTAFFVRDNGAGFDMAYADKLFGAFQRLHSAAEFPGTGIGLATVRRIIHRHGGKVWADGQVDRGATFFFTLSETGGGVADERQGNSAHRG